MKRRYTFERASKRCLRADAQVTDSNTVLCLVHLAAPYHRVRLKALTVRLPAEACSLTWDSR